MKTKKHAYLKNMTNKEIEGEIDALTKQNKTYRITSRGLMAVIGLSAFALIGCIGVGVDKRLEQSSKVGEIVLPAKQEYILQENDRLLEELKIDGDIQKFDDARRQLNRLSHDEFIEKYASPEVKTQVDDINVIYNPIVKNFAIGGFAGLGFVTASILSCYFVLMDKYKNEERIWGCKTELEFRTMKQQNEIQDEN